MSITTIDWPDWLEPAEYIPTLVKNPLVFRSAFGGSPQIGIQTGEYWRVGVTLPKCRIRSQASAARAAFFNRISGGGVRVRVPHFARRVPWGTLGGSPVLSSTAAAGAATLQISGALSRPNMIAGGDMEVDTNGDGLSDGMATYSAGTTGTITPDRISVTYGYAQRVFAGGLGTTNADRIGLKLPRVTVSAYVGQSISLACDVFGSFVAPATTANYYLSLVWVNSGGGTISETTTTDAALPTGSLTRVGVTGVVPSGAVYMDAYVVARRANAVGVVGLWVDRAQIELAAAPTNFAGPPSLLAGDRIGVLGQLFEVMDNVALNDIGSGTVYVNNRPRSSLASGSAVSWSSPTAIMACPGVPSPQYVFGWQDRIAIDLEEVWDA